MKGGKQPKNWRGDGQQKRSTKKNNTDNQWAAMAQAADPSSMLGGGSQLSKHQSEKPSYEVDEAIVSVDANEKMSTAAMQLTRSKTDGPGKRERRELQKVKIDPGQGPKHSLEEVIRMEGTGTFDQFKDRKTKYNENMYTTQYNERNITEEQKAIAERVEREILNSESTNRHMAEERGQINLRDNEEMEELAYSAARRQFSQAKNTTKRFQLGRGKRRDAFSQMQDRKIAQPPKDAAMFREWKEILCKSQKEETKKSVKAAEDQKKNAGQMKLGKTFTPAGFKSNSPSFTPTGSSQQEPMQTRQAGQPWSPATMNQMPAPNPPFQQRQQNGGGGHNPWQQMQTAAQWQGQQQRNWQPQQQQLNQSVFQNGRGMPPPYPK